MNTKRVQLLLLQSVLFISCLSSPSFSLETDTFSSSIKDPDTIISRNRMFKVGFFTPGNTTRRYLGIFYAFPENTVVWVANRDTPLNDSSGVVTISEDGNLVLVDGRNRTVWSNNVANTSIRSNTSVQILDSGNLVLRDDAAGNVMWQSFSHPSDVCLPTMNMTHNPITGKKVLITAWRSPTDPSPGSFTSGIDASNLPQSFIWHIDGRPHWRSGPWNGRIAIGVRSMYMYISYYDGLAVVKNDSASTFYYTLPLSSSIINNMKVNSSGSMAGTMWNDRDRRWDMIWLAPENECDIYGTCGPFESCNAADSPICSCLTGFEPTNRDEWERGNWSGGCRRKKRLQCGGGSGGGGGGAGDGFLRLQFMKVPDFAEQFFSRLEDECRTRCLGNCSCIAYAHDSNIGCMFWSVNLIDVQKFGGVGVDLYIRLPASELDNNKDRKLYIIIPAVAGFVCISILVFIAWCSMVKRKGRQIKDKNVSEAGQRFSLDSVAIVLKDGSENVDIQELPLFPFEALANATNQFHENNLLGRRGLLYLHKDSRLRIIHRDLKPSNILWWLPLCSR